MKRLSLLLVAGLFFSGEVEAQEQCAACHGAKGEGNAQTGAPRIAGQPAYYLHRQLEAYASGQRRHQVMEPIAKALSTQDRQRLAGYYADLSAPSAAKGSASAGSSSSSRARTLATRGDDERHVQACENCHGPGGTGFGNVIPYLAGLDAKYLVSALTEWKSGARNSDPSGQMQQVAKGLSDADVQAVASYYAALAAPRPVAPQKPASAGTQQQSTPSAGGSARQGTGVSGVEPANSGGTQGPGGGAPR